MCAPVLVACSSSGANGSSGVGMRSCAVPSASFGARSSRDAGEPGASLSSMTPARSISFLRVVPVAAWISPAAVPSTFA